MTILSLAMLAAGCSSDNGPDGSIEIDGSQRTQTLNAGNTQAEIVFTANGGWIATVKEAESPDRPEYRQI